jgi:hypothetical protein
LQLRGVGLLERWIAALSEKSLVKESSIFKQSLNDESNRLNYYF